MVQFLSINFFIGFLKFLLGFSKVPVFCVTLYNAVPKDNSIFAALHQNWVMVAGVLESISVV
jgi:hypothetical protein